MRQKNYTKELINSLSNATNEKDVEHAYWHCFSSYYPSCIGSENKTDGLMFCEDFTSLMEFKYDTNLKSKLESASVVLQSLFYLKKMEKQGKILPKSIFIGDADECFCINIVPPIAKYLVTNEIDWSTAPSKSPAIYPELVKKIAEDNDINPFIYNISVDLKFDFDEVISILKEMEKGECHPITITNENIIEIFNYFIRNVIKDKRYDVATLFDDHNANAKIRLADIFMTCLTDHANTFVHPNKKNTLMLRGEEIKIDTNLYKSFFLHFKQEYTPKELEVVVANKDRIFEEIYRRRTGAYFTPPIWVRESQNMIGEVLGDNWRDEYVVWDCACGTANLTRDNNFKELYLSTLEDGDINTIKDMGFNKGATIFKYDFLGEIGIDGVPDGLKKAMAEGKKILIYINPPYGTSSNMKQGTSKKDLAMTNIHPHMKNQDMGDAVKQIYAQFMWKIAELKKINNNIALGIFAPPTYLSGQKFPMFRQMFLGQFNFGNGMMFQASNFADVKDSWPISFTVWSNIGDNENLNVKVKEIEQTTFQIATRNNKTIYNLDGKISLNKWSRDKKDMLGKDVDAPQLSTAITVKPDGYGVMATNALGYMWCCKNIPESNSTNVAMFSSAFSGSNSNGYSIFPTNFNKTVALFTARKSIQSNWINCKDEYMVPDISHTEYAQWNNDAIIYSLFNNSSQQSSLRDIDYKGKKWDIQNHFFFMSNAEMAELANKNNFNEMYQDTKKFNKDSYVYILLQTTNLSPDAKEILDMAKALIVKSFTMRATYHAEHPEYHLNTWDAGWAQLKPMFKEYFKADYEAFVEKYKAFEDRMRLGVYKFGFLKE